MDRIDEALLARCPRHIGSSTKATRRAMAMRAAENAVAALTGERPPHPLNPDVIRT